MGIDKETSMLSTGALSIATGLVCRYTEPIFGEPLPMAIPLLFNVVGAGALYWYAHTHCKYTQLFKNLNLGTDKYCYPLLKKKVKTDYSTVYKFTLPDGLCLSDFTDNKEAIQQFAGKDIDIKYTYKEIVIEEYNEKMKEFIEYEPIKISGNVPLLVGYDRRENIISCDLADGEPHVLIAGETGSGKSTVLRSIITNFILKSSVKLHLVDLKSGTEFNVFRKSSKVIDFCKNVKEAETMLCRLSAEVDRRYDLFYQKDVKDIIEYNKKFARNKMSFDVVIIDEFADLQSNKVCKACLDELGRKARACGIHLILSTQRPSAKLLEGSVKSNITSIIGLKTLNNDNSRIVIDEPGLEDLRGKGHGIFKRGQKTEIQAPYLDIERCRELIKHTYIEKVTAQPKVESVNFDTMEVFQ